MGWRNGSTTSPTSYRAANSSAQDFYLISSGTNGATYDVLYVVSATSNTVGTITKYSLSGGSWVANGTAFSTGFGGFGLVAEKSGAGVYEKTSVGHGAYPKYFLSKFESNLI